MVKRTAVNHRLRLYKSNYKVEKLVESCLRVDNLKNLDESIIQNQTFPIGVFIFHFLSLSLSLSLSYDSHGGPRSTVPSNNRNFKTRPANRLAVIRSIIESNRRSRSDCHGNVNTVFVQSDFPLACLSGIHSDYYIYFFSSRNGP